jgi:potassium-dependent mechanosensitive channel
MRNFVILFFALCFANTVCAQKVAKPAKDTAKHTVDTVKPAVKTFDSSLFADSNILTASDYLVEIEKVQEVLNKVPLITSSFENAPEIANDLNLGDSALSVIQQGLGFDARVLSLRNIQMYQTLLDNLHQSNEKYVAELKGYNDDLEGLKKEILNLRKDTAVRHVFRDSALRKEFASQLQLLRWKWKNTDSLVRQATTLLNDLKAHASANEIMLSELSYRTDRRLKKLGPRAFTKEVPYLWESATVEQNPAMFEDYKKSADNLNRATHYYFINTRNDRLWLLFSAFVFFFWVFFNYRSLKKRSKTEAVNIFHFIFINPLPFAASFIVILTLAPLVDLDAPAIYLESVQFVLMLILTGVFWKRWSREMFYSWCFIIILFLLIPFATLLGVSYGVQRWLMFFVDMGSFIFGINFYQRVRKSTLRQRKLLLWAAAFYAVFNLLAAFANLSGRLTLTKILGTTAIYGFAQIISLSVFVRIITEAFLLQIVASRVRKKFPDNFEFRPIQMGITKFAGLLSVILWTITFTTNLNLFDTLDNMLQDFLTTPRNVGSFSFTAWGVLLFVGIVWIANMLQKYIAYFFGDTGDDAGLDNKGQRSRLLITRLILLIGGFLLAVAASGLPVDRITVILGALGVGIGLGLQSIVNNFVSGVILIFDRTLRIGDIVELGEKKGRVKEISIRSSTLLTSEGAEVIIPNGDILSHNIVNWTLSNSQIRAELSFTIEQLPDPDEIKKGITEIIHANASVVSKRDPEILLSNISGKGIQLTIFFWCKDVLKTDTAKSDIAKAIYDYLKGKEINVV